MANLSTKTGLPSFSAQDQAIINYFPDGGFERGTNGQAPAGWSQYNDGASAIPVDGTGGTAVPQVTMLVSSTSPIRGVNSAVITKDANNRQGVGFSFPFTISPVDRGITAGVDFELITSASYATGDLVFYIYDMTNSILVTPTLQALPKADNYGKFFSNYGLTTGTSYRFILHIATPNPSAWTVKIDTMTNSTSRTSASSADPSGEYENTNSFTIFGATSNPTPGAGTTLLRNTYRDGRWATIRFEIGQTAAGSGGVGDYIWPIPTGLTIDYNRTTSGFAKGCVGFGELLVGSLYYKVAAFVLNSGAYVNRVTCFLMNETQAEINWGGGSIGNLGNTTVNGSFTVRIAINEWANSANNTLNQNTQSPIRAGTIQAFAGATTPAGWLDCDGSAKLITDYPQLYAQIGTTWNTCTNPLTGVANSAPAAGSFRVPDLRGAFMRGVGTFSDSIGTNTSLAGYQGDQMQGHEHRLYGSTGSAGAITLPQIQVNLLQNLNYDTNAVGSSVLSDGVNGTPRRGTETRPRNVGVKYIIKAWDESFNLAGFAEATADRMGLVQGGRVPGSPGMAAIAPGYIGQTIAHVLSTQTALPAGSATYGDARSIALTAGTFRIDAFVNVDRNGATFTSTALIAGVSTTAGNSAADFAGGVNYTQDSANLPTTFGQFSLQVPSFTVRCDGTTITRLEDGVAFAAGTILYLKLYVGSFSSGSPLYRAKLVATRMA